MRRALFAAVASAALAGVAVADQPVTVTGTNPVTVAQTALDRAREALTCRYAFTVQENGATEQPIWADFNVSVRQTLQFDPRRPIGQRWKVVNTTKSDRVALRRQLNLGGRSEPRTDLLTLTVEGDIDVNDLAFTRETDDAWIFTFKPTASPRVQPSGHAFLNNLDGELWVSKATGSIVKRTLLVTDQINSGPGAIVSGNFQRSFAQGPGGFPFVASTAQQMKLSAQGRGVDSSGTQQYSAIEAICDPAEVSRIAEMEARDVGMERSDRPVATGTRMRK